MKLGIVANHFPKTSETFIYDHVVMMEESGLDVQVYANRPWPGDHGLLNEREWRPVFRNAPKTKREWAQYATPAIVSMSRRVGDRRAPALSAVSALRVENALDCWDFSEMDVLHAHYAWNGLVAAEVLRRRQLQTPLVVSLHGVDVSTAIASRWGTRDLRSLFEMADILLPVSVLQAQRLIEAGAPVGKIHVLPMGVECEWWASTTVQSRASSSDLLRVVSVGRLVEKKGFSDGIRAIALMVGDGLDVVYRIVGDGPLLQELRSLAATLGVAQRVEFLGSCRPEAIRELFADSDVLLAPYKTAKNLDQEGSPVVIKEAFSSGLPVVSTFHPGVSELVTPGRHGYLVPESDWRGLARALCSVASSPTTAKRMGSAARLDATRMWDASNLWSSVVDMYSRLIEERGT